MIDERRLETSPTQHIRNLMNSIKDGMLTVTYYDPIDPSYTRTYDVSCTAEDTDKLVSEYESLTDALKAIGDAREKIDSGAVIEDLLTAEQVAVWNTYIRDFDEEFDVNEDELNELYVRREDGDVLSDDENDTLERHHEWFEAQCGKRLPKKSHSPARLVNRAQRYEFMVSHNAPRIIIEEEGRCLAEELILYRFAIE